MRLWAHFRHHSDCLTVLEKREEDTTTRKGIGHHFEIAKEAKRFESGLSVLRNFKSDLEKQYDRYFLGFLWEKSLMCKYS